MAPAAAIAAVLSAVPLRPPTAAPARLSHRRRKQVCDSLGQFAKIGRDCKLGEKEKVWARFPGWVGRGRGGIDLWVRDDSSICAITFAPAAAIAAVLFAVPLRPPTAAPARLLFCAAAMRAFHAAKSLPASDAAPLSRRRRKQSCDSLGQFAKIGRDCKLDEKETVWARFPGWGGPGGAGEGGGASIFGGGMIHQHDCNQYDLRLDHIKRIRKARMLSDSATRVCAQI